MRATMVLVAMMASGCAATVAISPTTRALQRVAIAERTDLPWDWTIAGATHAPHLARLLRWADDQGIIIADVPLRAKRNLLGLVQESRLGGWVMLLDSAMATNGRFHTLAH